jgi:hypothetical protein
MQTRNCSTENNHEPGVLDFWSVRRQCAQKAETGRKPVARRLQIYLRFANVYPREPFVSKASSEREVGKNFWFG